MYYSTTSLGLKIVYRPMHMLAILLFLYLNRADCIKNNRAPPKTSTDLLRQKSLERISSEFNTVKGKSEYRFLITDLPEMLTDTACSVLWLNRPRRLGSRKNYRKFRRTSAEFDSMKCKLKSERSKEIAELFYYGCIDWLGRNAANIVIFAAWLNFIRVLSLH